MILGTCHFTLIAGRNNNNKIAEIEVLSKWKQHNNIISSSNKIVSTALKK